VPARRPHLVYGREITVGMSETRVATEDGQKPVVSNANSVHEKQLQNKVSGIQTIVEMQTILAVLIWSATFQHTAQEREQSSFVLAVWPAASAYQAMLIICFEAVCVRDVRMCVCVCLVRALQYANLCTRSIFYTCTTVTGHEHV